MTRLRAIYALHRDFDRNIHETRKSEFQGTYAALKRLLQNPPDDEETAIGMLATGSGSAPVRVWATAAVARARFARTVDDRKEAALYLAHAIVNFDSIPPVSVGYADSSYILRRVRKELKGLDISNEEVRAAVAQLKSRGDLPK